VVRVDAETADVNADTKQPEPSEPTLTQTQPESLVLRDFLHDAIEFVESFHVAIEFSPAHIYISALPFTPKDSLVAHTFSKHLLGSSSVAVLGTKPRGNLQVTVAAISSGGRFVTSASSDGTLLTCGGAQMENSTATTSCGEGVHATAIAISVDGDMIAVGSGCTVQVLDTRTDKGNPWGKTKDKHKGQILTLAFSPDAAWLVSGSDDKTVRLWKLSTEIWYRAVYMWAQEQVVRILALRWSLPSNSSVSTVAYSVNGRRIAAGYSCGAMQTLHAMTGGP